MPTTVPHQATREMLLGSDAVAHGVKLCRPDVIAAYPITPQTHIVETLSTMVDSGELDSQYVKVESEMSAIAACFGAAASGCRAFTATSSHGLALMHEMLHWVAGSRFPLVMVNANRALGAPWNIWADQSDSLSQRDTGWIQLYSETAQEALDSIILATWLTEKLMLPVMVNIDGFILSHTMEQLSLPVQADVDAFLPPYDPPYFLDPDNPHSFGAAATPDNFYQLRKFLAKTMRTVPKVYQEGNKLLSRFLGRAHQALECVQTEDAESIFLVSGAMTGTVREAVDSLRREGSKVGLIKLSMIRPFPQADLIQAVGHCQNIIVLNRAVSYGAGGTLTQEVRSALYYHDHKPKIFDLILSLGGKEVFPETIEEIVAKQEDLSPVDSNWF
jgi:pyruvate/2-oxoacid:ferredoxin oxidoreductase alpha subunit